MPGPKEQPLPPDVIGRDDAAEVLREAPALMGRRLLYETIRRMLSAQVYDVIDTSQTLLAEWAYAKAWRSDGQRTRALARWLHTYNHHRHHTATSGPPTSRVGNVIGHYS